MKQHIWLLGPPGVGKLSIGNILSKMLSYPLFHNALTVDFAQLLFEFNTQGYREFRNEIRYLFYNKVLQSNVKGLITTFCYKDPSNFDYINRISDILNNNWETYYVFLRANSDDLKKRVINKSRKYKKTICTEDALIKWIISSPNYQKYPETIPHSVIDTSLIPPEKTCMKIFEMIGKKISEEEIFSNMFSKGSDEYLKEEYLGKQDSN